ncbi:MAG: GNAT family N-acetyltransferase [Algibacter sp.]
MKIELFKFGLKSYLKQRMIKIKNITVKETYAVRHPVLRQGKPIESCAFDGDLLESTYHIGLFINDKLIGVTSLLISENPIFNEEKQYQLRGMGILDEFQGKGYGNLIIDYVKTLLKKKNIVFLWCNAREVAASFYTKNGFQITGNPFNIETIGKHYIMYKRL